MICDTLPKFLLRNVRECPQKVAIVESKKSRINSLSWNDYYLSVNYLTHGLVSIGVKPEDKAALIGDNCKEIIFIDLALQCCSAVPANIFPDASIHDLIELVHLLEAKILVIQGDRFSKECEVLPTTCPSLKHIVIIKKEGKESSEQNPFLVEYSTLVEKGIQWKNENKDIFEELVYKTNAEAISSITFTSGTTGLPKGVIHTQRNAVNFTNALQNNIDNLQNSSVLVGFPFSSIGGRKQLLIDPLKWRTVVNIGESLAGFTEDLCFFSPDIVVGIAYHWNKIAIKIENQCGLFSKFFKTKEKTWLLFRQQPEKLSRFIRYLFQAIDFSMFHPIRKSVGLAKASCCLSGGAPTSYSTLETLSIAGILVHQAYGITEMGGSVAVVSGAKIEAGNVGRPLKQVLIRLSDEGEILLSGPMIFSGYYKDEDLYHKVVRDNWYYTGDLGVFDQDGNLKVLGRKKDIIITSCGQKVLPSEIEARIKAASKANEVLVLGDKRKYLSALLFVKKKNDKSSFHVFHDCLKKVNETLPDGKKIKKYEIIELSTDWSQGKELTSSLKLRRDLLEKRYSENIERMYEGA